MRSRIHAVDVVNSSDAAHFIVWKRDGILAAVRAGGRRQALSGRAQGPRRHVRELPRRAVRHRLQHQPGEGRGRAEELRRPARSEMDRQDGQGASGLQRHHHDRDLPDGARSRLGVFREARQAEGHAGAVRRPIRPRSSRSASAPCMADGNEYNMLQIRRRRASRSRSSIATEGTPLIVGPNAHLQERAESERRAAVPELTASRRSASSSSSMSAGCARCIRWSRRSRGRKPFREIKIMKDDAGRRREE